MYSHSPSSDDREHEPSRSRQKPGSACEECRKRKLRCDRIHPQCGVCSDSGVTCTFRESRPPRGPKKGHLKALKSRIGRWILQLALQEIELTIILNFSPAALEHRLAEQQGGNVNNDASAEKGAPKWDNSSNDELELPLISDSPIFEADATTALESSAGLNPQGLLEGSQGIATSISDLMRADLCVHPSSRTVPIKLRAKLLDLGISCISIVSMNLRPYFTAVATFHGLSNPLKANHKTSCNMPCGH